MASRKCIIAFIVFVSTCSWVNSQTVDQHLKIALRSIGHEFLLQLEDSTSRVLPIEKIDGRYRLQFQRTFAFEPDMLSFSTVKALSESNISHRFIVEIEQCKTGALVHSFETSSKPKLTDLMACKQRPLPEDCYQFFFTPVAKKEPPVNIDHSPGLRKSRAYLFLSLLLGAGLVFYFRSRLRRPRSNENLISMGLYQFDKKNMLLTTREHTTQLSNKEAELLFLLLSNENNTLERGQILEIVWGDQGDYVGRTLDVFISKLRKKLQADPNLKIINVRGVGYRFVMS
ncbi:MAG TPA: winged helix-turn-helix domain-containing protein [Saprospiraceae bacterium]|nr:winged helix-turn-helix domain-containing protein [Saprospiraceae bacterium]